MIFYGPHKYRRSDIGLSEVSCRRTQWAKNARQSSQKTHGRHREWYLEPQKHTKLFSLWQGAIAAQRSMMVPVSWRHCYLIWRHRYYNSFLRKWSWPVLTRHPHCAPMLIWHQNSKIFTVSGVRSSIVLPLQLFTDNIKCSHNNWWWAHMGDFHKTRRLH